MRSISLISLFIGIATAAYFSDSCTYYNTQGQQVDFSGFNGWINVTDGESTWMINPCPQYIMNSDETNICAESNGALCKVLPDGKISVRGQDNSSLWSDYGTVGVEVMYASEEDCYIDPLDIASTSTYKTAIEFVCDSSNFMSAVVSQDEKDKCSLVTITINSYLACARDSEILIDPIDPEVSGEHVTIGIFAPIIAFIVSFFLCCCCCCVRRRRCRQQRICKQQFSNLAFQPVPSTQATRPAAVNGAPFNPYVPQPQYYYYYPTAQQTVHQQVPLENVTVDVSDERVARELQAQYDREAAQL